MPLEKKTLSFPLAKGMDEKPSAPSLGVDSLQAADNVRFEKTGQVRKRGGFVLTDSVLTATGGTTVSKGAAIAQYKDETLLLDGSSLYSKVSSPANYLIDKGTYVPMTIHNDAKHRQVARRQGNAQITEANGFRFYVWEEYAFDWTFYQVRYDIENIETGVFIKSDVDIAFASITTTGTNRLYKIHRPQCIAIGNRIFVFWLDIANSKIKYGSVDCSSVANAYLGVQNTATLQDHLSSPADITLDSTYPVFSIDHASTTTHSSAGILAYYAGSNTYTVRYVTADGVLAKGVAKVDITTGGATASFSNYVKGATPLPSDIFIKCLDGSAGATYASFVFGHNYASGGNTYAGLIVISDNLGAVLSDGDNTLSNGSSTGSLFILNGTAGMVTTSATDIYVPVTVFDGSKTGTSGKIVPEHFVRTYKMALSNRNMSGLGSYTLSRYKNLVAFNSTVTSDMFRYNSELYYTVSTVNDNAMRKDTEKDFKLVRGLSNSMIVLNRSSEPIGATKMGQCATCVTSEILTMDPEEFALVDATASLTTQKNRRLWTGTQRVIAKDSSTRFLFGASRFFGFVGYNAGASGDHSDDQDTIFGTSLVTCDFAPARTLASVDADGTWLGTGGFLHGYDGQKIFENDFLLNPSIRQLQQSGASASAYVAGGTVRGFPNGKTLKYSVVYEWGDANGNIYRSAPAPFNEITIATGGVKTVGTVTGGSGYTNGTYDVTMGGGDGTGAVFNITVSGGAVASVNSVTSQGSGYTNGNTLTFPGGSSGSVADTVVYNTNRVLVDFYPLNLSFTRKNDVRVKIYRTEDDGAQFYEVGSIEPSATAEAHDQFIDMPSDYVNAVNHDVIYTVDGEVESGCFGSCTDLVRHQNKVFAAGIDDNVYMSVPLTDGSAVRFPASYAEFQLNFPGDSSKLTAIESNLDHLVIFTENNGFFVSGRGPDRLGFGPYGPPRLFASGQGAKAGAAHTDSPVGAFIQSDRGIYVIGRDMSVKYLGAQVEDKTSKLAVNMLRHDETNEVRIMLSNKGTASGSDEYLVYNYYFGQWSRYTVAYTSSAWQVGEVYDGTTFQRLTADGKQWAQSTAVFQDNSANYDMVIDTGFISPTGILRKDRIYRFMYLGEYKGAHEAEAQIYVDYKASDTASPTIDVSGAPSDIFLYRTHMPSQKNRALRIKLVLTGSTECAYLNGLALEVGVRPEATNFKTSQARTF